MAPDWEAQPSACIDPIPGTSNQGRTRYHLQQHLFDIGLVSHQSHVRLERWTVVVALWFSSIPPTRGTWVDYLSVWTLSLPQ